MRETTRSTVRGLSDRDRRVLDFEQDAPSRPRARRRRSVGARPHVRPRYQQLLGSLIERPAALAYAPMLVGRLLRLRDSCGRRAQRPHLRRADPGADPRALARRPTEITHPWRSSPTTVSTACPTRCCASAPTAPEPRRHGGWIVFAWAALAVRRARRQRRRLARRDQQQLPVPQPDDESERRRRHDAPSGSPPVRARRRSPRRPRRPAVTDPSKVDSTKTTITVLNAHRDRGPRGHRRHRARERRLVGRQQGQRVERRSRTSVVYYDGRRPTTKAIALGIAKKLGITTVSRARRSPGPRSRWCSGADYTSK